MRRAPWGASLLSLLSLACANVLGLESGYEASDEGTGGGDSGGRSAGTGGTGSGGVSAGGTNAGVGGNGTQSGLVLQALAAGTSHGCGLRSGGQVVCWGGFYSDILAVPSGSYDAIFSGNEASCALSGGYATCWGAAATLTQAVPNVAFQSLAVGNGFACGVLQANGALECWGDYLPGALAGSFTRVAVGDEFICGLGLDKSINCVGDSIFGEPLPPQGSFDDLVAGTGFGCALAEGSRTVSCFNEDGALTFGIPTGPFDRLAAYGATVCGLRSSGQIVCFGDDTWGSVNPPQGSFVQLSVGGDFACALDAGGRVSCWGSSFRGGGDPPSE